MNDNSSFCREILSVFLELEDRWNFLVIACIHEALQRASWAFQVLSLSFLLKLRALSR